MQEKVRGIVLGIKPFSDNNYIVKMFTRESGLTSFVVGNIHSSKSSTRSSAFIHLSVNEIIVSSPKKGTLSRIKEVNPVLPLHSLASHPIKRTVGFFIAEVINLSLHESHIDQDLYDFIENSIFYLELSENCPPDFHLIMLWKLTHFLGIKPNLNYNSQKTQYFDIVNGCFVDEYFGDHVIKSENSYYLYQILISDYSLQQQLSLPRNIRQELLYFTTQYFAFHLGWKKEVHSLEVLHEVFQEA